MAQVAILLPTMRAHNLAGVVQSIQESTEDYRIIVIGTGDCAESARSLPVTLIDDGGGTWPQRVNLGYGQTTEPYIFAGADDLSFKPGWFPAAMRVMDTIDGGGCVAVNDLMNRAGVHLLFARTYIETVGAAMGEPLGTVICEQFQHAYCDDFARKTAEHHGRWGFANDSIVEHLHCGVGKAPHDEVYAIGEASMSAGLATFHALASRFE